MTIPEPIAIVTNHDSMVDAFRAMKDKLGLSDAWCDEIGGLAVNHTAKVLGPARVKGLGRLTIDTFCEMFGVQFVMVPNMDAVKRMEARWEKRESGRIHISAGRVNKAQVERAKPVVLKEFAALGVAARHAQLTGEQRSKIGRKASRKSRRTRHLPPEQRSAIASKAAKARWVKS